MDVDYINPFITATTRLFQTMIKVPLKLGRPALRRPDDREFKLYPLSAITDLTPKPRSETVKLPNESSLSSTPSEGSEDADGEVAQNMVSPKGVSGRIVIAFAHPVACALAEALAGRAFTTNDEELPDAIAEIANMIVGGARTSLPNAAELRLSPPKVVPTHSVVFPHGPAVIVIPFDTAAGRFIIETDLRTGDPIRRAASAA